MKEQNVVNYYVSCNKLKNVLRKGWKDWNVEKERLESVAEHIYGVQMLAIAMYSEYKYDIDLEKVLFMLAIHELEEITIGDLTLFDIDKAEKEKIGHEAVIKTLSPLMDKDKLLDLVLEFDARETKEAKFAFFCDKLEADIQSKIYDEKGCVDLKNQDNNPTSKDPVVKRLIEEGNTFGQMWMKFSQGRYNYDENFQKVSNYVINNKITKE